MKYEFIIEECPPAILAARLGTLGFEMRDIRPTKTGRSARVQYERITSGEPETVYIRMKRTGSKIYLVAITQNPITVRQLTSGFFPII